MQNKKNWQTNENAKWDLNTTWLDKHMTKVVRLSTAHIYAMDTPAVCDEQWNIIQMYKQSRRINAQDHRWNKRAGASGAYTRVSETPKSKSPAGSFLKKEKKWTTQFSLLYIIGNCWPKRAWNPFYIRLTRTKIENWYFYSLNMDWRNQACSSPMNFSREIDANRVLWVEWLHVPCTTHRLLHLMFFTIHKGIRVLCPPPHAVYYGLSYCTCFIQRADRLSWFWKLYISASATASLLGFSSITVCNMFAPPCQESKLVGHDDKHCTRRRQS